MKKPTGFIVKSAVIGAFYAVLTLTFAPISFGTFGVDFRIAEALCVLPALDPSAVWGLFIGCVISNAVGAGTGANIAGAADIFIGSAATLIAALLTRKLRNIKHFGIPLLSFLPPVLCNGLAVGAELGFFLPQVYSYTWGFISVAVGETVVIALLGIPLYIFTKKTGLLGKI